MSSSGVGTGLKSLLGEEGLGKDWYCKMVLFEELSHETLNLESGYLMDKK